MPGAGDRKVNKIQSRQGLPVYNVLVTILIWEKCTEPHCESGAEVSVLHILSSLTHDLDARDATFQMRKLILVNFIQLLEDIHLNTKQRQDLNPGLSDTKTFPWRLWLQLLACFLFSPSRQAFAFVSRNVLSYFILSMLSGFWLSYFPPVLLRYN